MQVRNKIPDYLRSTFRTVFLGINIFTLLLLMSSFLVWYVSPAHTTILSYLGLAFPAILVACISFLIFWMILLNRKFVLLNIIVLLVCYKPITTYFPLNFIKSEAPEDAIKFLSYNVRGARWDLNKPWDEKHPFVQYIKQVDADIICLQEYMASTSDKHAGSRNLQKILKKYPYYSEVPLRTKNGGYMYGLVCFSRYPIIETKQIPLKSTDNGSALFKINMDGKIIHVINNHLESNRLTSADKKLYRDFFKERGDAVKINDITQNLEERLGTAYVKRAPQADMVAQYVEETGADATIVCGDFNDTPISYTYKTIGKNLQDAYAESGFGVGITYHENHFWFRIDYIMHSKNMKAHRFTIDKIKLSDHYPVWTYLSFK